MPSNMSAAVRVEGHSSKSAVGHATRVQLSTASVRFAAMRMKVVFTASKMKIKSVMIQQSGLTLSLHSALREQTCEYIKIWPKDV